MKCLTVRQPWAHLIASGAKTIEVRSWRTHYRGPLAIHAGCGRDPGCEPGVSYASSELVAIVDLLDVRRLQAADMKGTSLHPKQFHGCLAGGHYGWHIRLMRTLRVPMKGRLGLFSPTPEAAQLLGAA